MSESPDLLRLHGDAYTREGLLDFAVNVWPGAHPVPLRRVLQAALRSGYPDERAAVAAVARRHGRSPGEVLLLNGACVARVQRRQPDFALDPAAVPDDVGIVVTGNPNNPTGNLDDAAQILRLTRPGRLVAVVRSLTKLWSLAGVRAGYLLADPTIIERMRSRRQPWSVNAPACAALEFCMTDHRSRRRVSAAVSDARAKLIAAVAAIDGVTVWPSQANFLLLRVPHGPETIARLGAAGIAVRPAHTFPGLGPDHLRIAVRHDVENRRLVRALAQAIGGEHAA